MVSSLKFGLNKMKYLRLRVISEVTTPFGFNRYIPIYLFNYYITKFINFLYIFFFFFFFFFYFFKKKIYIYIYIIKYYICFN